MRHATTSTCGCRSVVGGGGGEQGKDVMCGMQRGLKGACNTARNSLAGVHFINFRHVSDVAGCKSSAAKLFENLRRSQTICGSFPYRNEACSAMQCSEHPPPLPPLYPPYTPLGLDCCNALHILGSDCAMHNLMTAD